MQRSTERIFAGRGRARGCTALVRPGDDRRIAGAGRQLADAAEAAAQYRRASRSENTRRAYRSAVARFTEWCAVHGQAALPASPETVAAFLAAEARSELAINTLRLRHAAIRYMHLLAGYSPPTAAPVVSTTLAGIKRTHRRTLRKKAALVLEPLRAAVAGMSDTLPGLRDRALLLVGFGAALRPSEIARLRLDHLTRHADGLELFLPWRKNDQDARGTRLWLPKGRTDLCPVMVLEHWLAASAITEGPLLRRIWRLPPPRRRKGTRGKPITDRYPASWIAIGMRRRASPYRRRCVGPIGSCAPGAPGGRLINWPARPRIFECAGGGRQHSVTAGTVFHRTSTPLRKWFGAAWLIGQDKRGVSALFLARELAMRYDTAWLMAHKLRQLRRAASRPTITYRQFVDGIQLSGAFPALTG